MYCLGKASEIREATRLMRFLEFQALGVGSHVLLETGDPLGDREVRALGDLGEALRAGGRASPAGGVQGQAAMST